MNFSPAGTGSRIETIYFNGEFIPKEKVCISPDDRGFLFADGIYEVVRWYGNSFFDMAGHMARLNRSLEAVKINWPDADKFPSIAGQLVKLNNPGNNPSMVYLQVTRGAARRTHNFPLNEISPTVYSYAWGFTPDLTSYEKGIRVILKDDIRWKRCDIKSVALLPNILSYQEAFSGGFKECAFVRDGNITECSHSNIFLVRDNVLFTYPESCFILSGISRKNVIRIARENSIQVNETPYRADEIRDADEAFITNTSAEITPVTEIGGIRIADGKRGKTTEFLQEKFRKQTECV